MVRDMHGAFKRCRPDQQADSCAVLCGAVQCSAVRCSAVLCGDMQ